MKKTLLFMLLLAIATISCDKIDDDPPPYPVYPTCRIEFTNVKVSHTWSDSMDYQIRFRIGIISSNGKLSNGGNIGTNGEYYDYGIPYPVWNIRYRNAKIPYGGYYGTCEYVFDLVNDDIVIQLKPINSRSILETFILHVYIDGKLEQTITSMYGEYKFYNIIKMKNNY